MSTPDSARAPVAEPAPAPAGELGAARIACGFRIHEEVGRGGMGVVFRAEEIASSRIVALKTLTPAFARTPDALQRFHREARVAASLSHPNCVFVYGAHEIDGQPALAMEWMEGGTLEDRMRAPEPIPIATAVRWTLDLLDGLEAAHRLGIVHRDVKPSNCFLAADGRLKVGDFGLARALESDIRLTQSGQFLGSPLYAPAEQIRGDEVDARSDLYSCGATLYALLTGRPPFPGQDLGRVLARILTEDPIPPRLLRPEIPSGLEEIVLRALQRDRAKRPADAEAMRAALAPFAAEAEVAGKLPRRLGAYFVDFCVLIILGGTLQSLAYGRSSGGILAMPTWAQILFGLVPILYFGALEAWSGSSLGKWLFALRVVPVGPGPERRVRAVLRATAFQLPLVLGGLVVTTALPLALASTWQVAVALHGGYCVYLMSTMRRRNGWRGPHELLSRTRVVEAASPFARARRAAPEPAPEVVTESGSVPGVPERLGRYRVLGLMSAAEAGTVVHARDERLDRSVWIRLAHDRDPLDGARRTLDRPARLRWLEDVSEGDLRGDVFESPGGCSLREHVARGATHDWSRAEGWLSALADELARSEKDGGAARTYSLEQVWVDRNGDVRLIDRSLLAQAGAPTSATGLLGEAARLLLTRGRAGAALAADLPMQVEPLVRALTGDEAARPSLEEVRAALAASRSMPAGVTLRTRAAQLALSTAPGLMMLALIAIGIFVVAGVLPRMVEVRELLWELSTGQVRTETRATAPTMLDEAGRSARQLALSYELAHAEGPMIPSSLRAEDRPFCEEARRLHPEVSAEQHASALQRIHAERGRSGAARDDPFERPEFVLMALTAGLAGTWSFVACALAWIWPGGPSFRILGLSLRTRDGKRARRWLGFVRSAAIGVPLYVGFMVAAVLYLNGRQAAAWGVFGLVSLVFLAGLCLSLAQPSRGPIDRLLGTRIVPR